MKGGAPPDPCRAVLSFADAQGAPTGSSQLVDLAPGQIAFLDINPSRLTTNALAAGRTMIQPRLSAAPAAPVDTIGTTVGGSLAGCLASVQLYDSATGWSTEVVQGR